jgi:hypothetical protein
MEFSEMLKIQILLFHKDKDDGFIFGPGWDYYLNDLVNN